MIWSIISSKDIPIPFSIFGYLLCPVKPGIVFTSLKYNSPFLVKINPPLRILCTPEPGKFPWPFPVFSFPQRLLSGQAYVSAKSLNCIFLCNQNPGTIQFHPLVPQPDPGYLKQHIPLRSLQSPLFCNDQVIMCESKFDCSVCFFHFCNPCNSKGGSGFYRLNKHWEL